MASIPLFFSNLLRNPFETTASHQVTRQFKERFEQDLQLTDTYSTTDLVRVDRIVEEIDQEELNKCLENERSYIQNLERIHSFVYSAFIKLQRSHSIETINTAKHVYKALSKFYRNQVDPQFLKGQKLRNVLERDNKHIFSFNKNGSRQSLWILAEQLKTQQQGISHAAIYFFMKGLRKKIKLLTKHSTIQNKIKSNPDFKDLTEDQMKKCLNCLHLSWMHGTKASVIAVACDKTHGMIMPKGELDKYQVATATGENQNGHNVINGVNHASLSGVNLKFANTSIKYANSFNFSFNEEKEFLTKFLSLKLVSLSDVSDSRGQSARWVSALQRIAKYDPLFFKTQCKPIRKKLAKIYSFLEKKILPSKSSNLFRDFESYAPDVYKFLKSLEKIEELLAQDIVPFTEEEKQHLDHPIPVVLASKDHVGIPLELSDYYESPEEIYPGSLKLGEDITYIFTKEECIPKVECLLENKGLKNKMHVLPMEILETAQKMEEFLGTYFSDVVSFRKWKDQVPEDFYI